MKFATACALLVAGVGLVACGTKSDSGDGDASSTPPAKTAPETSGDETADMGKTDADSTADAVADAAGGAVAAETTFTLAIDGMT